MLNQHTNAKQGSSNEEVPQWDYILVGGGLQSGLMALAICHHQPQAKVMLIEQQGKLAGNHTWSFHASDIPESCAVWAKLVAEYRWPTYEIRVGGKVRTVEIPYLTCSSSHFAQVVESCMQQRPRQVACGVTAIEITSSSVTLNDGTRSTAAVVIDNRGPVPTTGGSYSGGYQKFWGFEVELDSDWPHENPIVMDDRIDQNDGFRFIYSLPMERRRVLVEDTRFSNTASIDRGECLQKVKEYVHAQGCKEFRIVREEQGVLPMPIRGALPGHDSSNLSGGYRGGWFHAATGYSFPLAIRVAELVATTPKEDLTRAFRLLSSEQVGRAKFARFLNRLLFELVKPQARYQIFRRFYRVLDEKAIARFYGHRFTWFDAFRIVVGRPPLGLRPLNFIRSYKTVPTSRVASAISTQTTKVPG